MKHVSLPAVRRILVDYWPVIVGVVLLLIGIIGLSLSVHHTQGHEGGFVPTKQAAHVAAKLPDTSATPAATAASSAAHNCAENGSGKLLLVSISQQHIWACDGTALANESAVTTGASALTNVDNATPTGTWHIYSKQTNTTLKGCDVNGCWNDPVAYWMPFDDQVGFHDSSWQTFPYGSSLYATQGSHGCVHLPADFIAWVYGWAPIGTTVTVEA